MLSITLHLVYFQWNIFDMAQSVPTTNISFPGEEEKILKYWKEIDAFRTSLKQSKGKPRWVQYIKLKFVAHLNFPRKFGALIIRLISKWAKTKDAPWKWLTWFSCMSFLIVRKSCIHRAIFIHLNFELRIITTFWYFESYLVMSTWVI